MNNGLRFLRTLNSEITTVNIDDYTIMNKTTNWNLKKQEDLRKYLN